MMQRYLLILVLLVTGCGEQLPDSIFAKVGAMTVHRASIEATVGSPIDKAAPDAIDAALVGLVSTARQAAAAHAAGLQTDPRVQAELEVARQRVLARAWRRHAGQTVHEEAIASRFEGQKEALTERIYDLDFIRVPIKDGDRIAALNQARTAYAQLRDGTPFTQVARRFSQDGPSKTRGGHLGKVEGRRLPVPVRQKLDELAVGTPTPPIELKDAVVVARLRSKVIVQPPQLAHFAPRLRAELHNEAQALDEAILAERFPIKMRGKGGVQ